jgi:hypothetical protein
LIEGAIQFAAEELHLAVPDPRPVNDVDMDDLRKVATKK